MSAMEEVMMQDLGRARKEDVSTQDFGRHSRPLTAREARMIENSRLANQYGTPEYIEANDPVKKAKRAGWNALAAAGEDDGLDDLDNGQGFRRAKLLANDTSRFANPQPAQMSHRPAPPRPTQPSLQRQPARPVTSAPTPAIHSTPKGPKNNNSNSRNAHTCGNGFQAAHNSSAAKGDLASRITYSTGSGARINNASAAGNNLNNRGLSRPSDDARSIPAARLANIAHQTIPPPRAQQSRNPSSQAPVAPTGPAGSRRASSDYNDVPTGPSGRANRRQPPARPAVDLLDPAQWLAITNAKIRPKQTTTASAPQTKTKADVDPPTLPTNQSSSQPAKTVADPTPLPTNQSSSQPAKTVTKQLPTTGAAPTQSSGTTPSTTAVTKSSAITSNSIFKQNGNLAANTAALNAARPVTNEGAVNKNVNKPARQYDVATLKALARPSEAVSRSTRPAQPQVAASENLISISTGSPPESKEAAAKKESANDELFGLIMSNGRGGRGLAASKWAK